MQTPKFTSFIPEKHQVDANMNKDLNQEDKSVFSDEENYDQDNNIDQNISLLNLAENEEIHLNKERNKLLKRLFSDEIMQQAQASEDDDDSDEIKQKGKNQKLQEILQNSESESQSDGEEDKKQQNFQGIESEELKNCNGDSSNSSNQIQGWLKKRSHYALQGWQTRYCQVKNKKFVYYDKKNLEKVIGCIDFDLLSVDVQVSGEHNTTRRFNLIVKGTKKIFRFRAADNNEIKKWLQVIQTNIQESQGHKKILTHVVKQYKFWKNDRISEQQFLSMIDTGDILLFRGKNLGASLQRSLTRSHYDHIAFLLKFNDGDIVMLEATAGEGVGLCTWKQFVANKWHLLYKKHLEYSRTPQMIEELEKFIKGVVGQRYKFTAKKLWKKQKSQEEINQNSTFFCSELIATAYKRIGLLPKTKSASHYWPGSFSTEKNIHFSKGAKLSDEYQIDFSLNQIYSLNLQS